MKIVSELCNGQCDIVYFEDKSTTIQGHSQDHKDWCEVTNTNLISTSIQEKRSPYNLLSTLPSNISIISQLTAGTN